MPADHTHRRVCPHSAPARRRQGRVACQQQWVDPIKHSRFLRVLTVPFSSPTYCKKVQQRYDVRDVIFIPLISCSGGIFQAYKPVLQCTVWVLHSQHLPNSLWTGQHVSYRVLHCMNLKGQFTQIHKKQKTFSHFVQVVSHHTDHLKIPFTQKCVSYIVSSKISDHVSV